MKAPLPLLALKWVALDWPAALFGPDWGEALLLLLALAWVASKRPAALFGPNWGDAPLLLHVLGWGTAELPAASSAIVKVVGRYRDSSDEAGPPIFLSNISEPVLAGLKVLSNRWPRATQAHLALDDRRR